MKKRETWRSDLFRFIDEQEAAVFEYGVLDCCLFAASAVEVMTGEDPAAGFRGQYINEFSGMKALAAAGYRDQFDFLERNFTEVEPAFTQAGDVVVYQNSVGVCAGQTSAFISESGLSFIDTINVERAFRV